MPVVIQRAHTHTNIHINTEPTTKVADGFPFDQDEHLLRLLPLLIGVHQHTRKIAHVQLLLFNITFPHNPISIPTLSETFVCSPITLLHNLCQAAENLRVQVQWRERGVEGQM